MSQENSQLGHIGVLMGGCSSEREISLKSGKAVFKALDEEGCHVSALEIDSVKEEDFLQMVKNARLDVAFLALHGEFGEDGTVQTILEKAGIPYTGSDARTSRITINKVMTQELLKQNGLRVPEFCILSRDKRISSDEIVRILKGLPVVVKPAREGSSIGITIVQDQGEMEDAIRLAFSYGSEVLVDRYIQGKEITAGILDGKALPLVEIRPKASFFDFNAKYQKGMTEYIVPAEISVLATKKIQDDALKAYRVLGCRDLSRIDFILDRQDKAFLLEVNTIPGFTATSLLPMAAGHVGISFTDLCLKIARSALQRKVKTGLKELV